MTFENEKLAGVRIKKVDAVTGEGIYGVRFLIKDEDNNLIGEYSTDQDGYIELDDLLTDGRANQDQGGGDRCRGRLCAG